MAISGCAGATSKIWDALHILGVLKLPLQMPSARLLVLKGNLMNADICGLMQVLAISGCAGATSDI